MFTWSFERMARDHKEPGAVLRERGYYSWTAIRQSFRLVRRDLRGQLS